MKHRQSMSRWRVEKCKSIRIKAEHIRYPQLGLDRIRMLDHTNPRYCLWHKEAEDGAWMVGVWHTHFSDCRQLGIGVLGVMDVG